MSRFTRQTPFSQTSVGANDSVAQAVPLQARNDAEPEAASACAEQSRAERPRSPVQVAVLPDQCLPDGGEIQKWRIKRWSDLVVSKVDLGDPRFAPSPKEGTSPANAKITSFLRHFCPK